MIEEFYYVNTSTTSVHFRHGNQALAAFLDGSVRPLDMATDMQPGENSTHAYPCRQYRDVCRPNI